MSIEIQTPDSITLTEPIKLTRNGQVLDLGGNRIRAEGFPAIVLDGKGPLRYCRVINGEVYGSIVADNITDCSFRDLYIHNSEKDGLRIHRGWRNTISAVKSHGNKGHGVTLSQCNSSTLTGVTVSGNQGDGLHLSDSAVATNILGITSEGNKGWGIGYTRTRGTVKTFVLTGAYMEGNKSGGINMQGGGEKWGIDIIGNRLDSPIRIQAINGMFLNNHILSNKGPKGTDEKANSEVTLKGNGWLTMGTRGHILKSPPFGHEEFNVFGIQTTEGK